MHHSKTGRSHSLPLRVNFPIVIVLLFHYTPNYQVLSINPVLDLNNTYPYLINKLTGLVTEPRDYFNFDYIYNPNETYKRQTSAQVRNYHLLKAFDFANYFQTDHWHYSDPNDLELSAYPIANKLKCSQHLNWIEDNLNRSRTENILFLPGEQHSNLMTLIDSFGRPEASTFYGHGIWVGSYYECLRVRIDLEKFRKEECEQHNIVNCEPQLNGHFRGRYCIGKARDIDWPTYEEDDYTPNITYKIGFCLPETCETSSINSHRLQLERLMRFNMPNYWQPRLNLTDIYCLPDRRSPIRAMNSSGRIFLSLISMWLITLLAATIVYQFYKRHSQDMRRILTQNFAPECHQGITATSITTANNYEDVYQDPNKSSTSNEVNLGSISSLSMRSWLNKSPKVIKMLKALSIIENMLDLCKPPKLLDNAEDLKRLRVNLNPLDFIKCLCCIFVIFGHIVFIHMQHLTNIVHTIELSYELYPRILIALFNFVDTFFIISGMLTAYFVFKRFGEKNFGPTAWLYTSLLRILRLSPVYILVFWFTKTITVHLADGPLWDYATDKNSIKGLCSNDHWWKSLLYLGNYGTMQPLCILPAWSIIVDSQYSLIIPPALFVVMKHKRFGYVALLFAVVGSTLNMTWQLASQTAVKTSDMAKVRLHVYPLISRFGAEFYNTAFNRMGPVAIGILGGHLLYLYGKGNIRTWPRLLQGTSFKIILMLHIFVFILPTLGMLTDDPSSNDDSNFTIFLISNATIKPIWSLINTIFILRLVTDLRLRSTVVRIMAHNVWHCLGKLCFASYLIHYEIILIFLKSRHEGLVDPDWAQIAREFSFVFLVSTVIAYFVHILYEAPINNLITMIVNKKTRNLQQVNNDIDIDRGDIRRDHNRTMYLSDRTSSREVQRLEIS